MVNEFIKKLLLILFISLGLIGCATNQMLDDGYFYKDIGGTKCQSYQVVSPKRIKCFDSNGNFTYEQDAMTEHEVIAWKMDVQNAAIMSIQSQQMWSNINAGGNYQRNINQQNLNNMWWDY